MPTTFANTINGDEILAKRSQCDYAGNDIQTTYATKSELPTATSDLTNDSGFITSSDVPVKDVEVNGTSVVDAQGVASIDLSDYATTQALTNGLATKQDTISDLATIRSGAALGASAIQPGDLATVATTGSYSDLSNKPSIPTATSDLTNDSGFITSSDIPVTDVTVNGTSVVSSGVAAVTVPTATSDLTNDSGFITLSDVPAQVNADWDSNSGASEILNKPDLSIYAETANLATVATTGDYDDLVNKPTIPAAQVNSDWNSNSGVSQILNKPTLSTVATTGDYDDLVNKPSIPAAQVNADWDASSGVSEILNKPVIPSGSQLVPAATSADADKVLTVNAQGTPAWATAQAPISAGDGIDITNNVVSAKVDGTTIDTNASGELTIIGGGGGTQVNSDWDATSGVAEILNKPVPKTLTAGANISISEGVGTLTISAAAGLPASTSADEGKCLVVDSNGDPEWGTGGKTYTGIDGVVVDNVNNTVGLEAPVDIVAGPGIVIDNPDGNTLRVSQAYPTDETVLFTGTIGSPGSTGVLSEAVTNFEFIEVYTEPVYGGMFPVVTRFATISSGNSVRFGTFSQDGGLSYLANYTVDFTGASVSVPRAKRISINHSNGSVSVTDIVTTGSFKAPITKIVGIHRIQGGN